MTKTINTTRREVIISKDAEVIKESAPDQTTCEHEWDEAQSVSGCQINIDVCGKCGFTDAY